MAVANEQGQFSKKQRFWQAHIKAWKRSGLSQNEYCRRSQISSSQLGYWKKKLLQGASPPLKFVSVSAAQLQTTSSGGDSGLTIFLGDSIKIGLTDDFVPTTLAKVIATLGDRR